MVIDKDSIHGTAVIEGSGGREVDMIVTTSKRHFQAKSQEG